MMKNIEALKDWKNSARRGLENELDRLREKEEQMSDYLRALDATDELFAAVDDLNVQLARYQEEVDRLTAELEHQQEEMRRLRDELTEKSEALTAANTALVELKEQRLTAESAAKATEIHNHFESGSSAQVFNDKVTGKVTKKNKKWKRIARRIM